MELVDIEFITGMLFIIAAIMTYGHYFIPPSNTILL